jgi:glycerate kinase
MKGASLAITGEGRVDFQTAFGKTPSGVAQSARRHGVPVVAIGGGLSDDAGGVFQHGIDGLGTATPNAMPLDVAIKKSRQYLQDAAERVARLVVIGQRIGAAASTGASATASPGVAASSLNGAGHHPVVLQPVGKRNKPVKRFLRAKRVQGLTRAAVELSQRRRQRFTPTN